MAKGGETAGIPGAMPGDPSSVMGIDPQTLRALMGMQYMSAAAGNLAAMGPNRAGQQPIPQSNPMAMITPMLQMQQMGMVGQERERKLAEQRAQASAYYGPEDRRSGGAGTWVNPDTGMPQYTGMISKVSPQLQPLLGAMDADKGTGTLATIMAQQMKPKELPADVQSYEFAKTEAGGGYKGTFEDWRKAAGVGNTPSNLQEWAAFKDMKPEDQEKYLTMKRAQSWVNLGGSQVLPSAVNPAGSPRASMDVTLKPEEDPNLKYKQAFETAMGKADAELKGEGQKKALNALRTLDNLEGVESLIDKSTGSFGGAALDAMASMFGHATEGAIASGKLKVLQAGLMTSMPRMEGPQSDRDVQLYREAAGQIGDPTVPNAIKKAAVETIRELQKKYQVSSMAPKVNPPATSNDGWSIKPVSR